MSSPEGEPTHSIIFRNGNNGVLKAKDFGGVTPDSVFISEEQIYVSREFFESMKQAERNTNKIPQRRSITTGI